MKTKLQRCVIASCRRWYRPDVRVGARQKACSLECSRVLRNQRARKRREKDIQDARVNERERKKRQRQKRREKAQQPVRAWSDKPAESRYEHPEQIPGLPSQSTPGASKEGGNPPQHEGLTKEVSRPHLAPQDQELIEEILKKMDRVMAEGQKVSRAYLGLELAEMVSKIRQIRGQGEVQGGAEARVSHPHLIARVDEIQEEIARFLDEMSRA